MKSPDAPDYMIGIAGAGAMGQGIAQVAAMGGLKTLLLDSRPGAAEAAVTAIGKRLDRLVKKGRLPAKQSADAKGRLMVATGTADLAPCNTVIEAIFENLDAKRTLFQEIEAAVGAACLIASNTSSIPIAAIARACTRRDRIAGLHFFNPVPVMQLVEVIRGPETGEAVIAALTALSRRLGRTPVTVKDAPGFLVNLGGRAMTTEGLRIAHEAIATPAQIDAIMRDCGGFRMGPFELMDLTGIDVNYPVTQVIYDGYQQDPRLRTSPNHKAMFDAGRFGRKTGIGWYRYDGDGRMIDPPSPDHVCAAAPARRVALAEANAGLNAFCAGLGLTVIEDDGSAPILAAPVGEDATHTALRTGADARRLVALDLTGHTDKRVTFMTAPGADTSLGDAVAAAIAASGRKVTAIKDSPGFVAQRMCAMIANLGCYMAEIALATPQDIDVAMKLGLNYPLGPLELADKLGAKATLRILERLQAITGDDRYRPTPWLSRRAALGLPIHTPT